MTKKVKKTWMRVELAKVLGRKKKKGKDNSLEIKIEGDQIALI